MEFRRSSFNFPSSRQPTQAASQTLTFPRNVRAVGVGIIGYSAGYANGDDHELGRLTVEMNASINAGDRTEVNVRGSFGLRDWSGEFDDNYSGNIQWVVLAELESVAPPAPGAARADLLIIDAEITQVIQHFRSAEHLNAENVFPDNSIRLVSNKPTVVRYYVDYDSTSGLPIIANLTGELVVNSGGMTSTLAPSSPIMPRRNGSIDRGNIRHTLNFFIPENLCMGVVELTAKVFSTRDAGQFSADFTSSLVFEALPALPVITVGVNYTGTNIDDGALPAALIAPVMQDFIDVFQYTEKIYPIPEVSITSYNTMDYDNDMESDISAGCDKFGDLLDELDDFKGDSDDLVFGLINSGVNNGSVGGCGRDGVSAGIIRAQDTAAHELGHSLGRQHAPCDNVTRCATPLNTDDNFPVYSGYNSDSIGEYGFDTTLSPGMVFSPGNTHDFMGYSGNTWISPYTYKALMTRIPGTFGASAPSGASRSAISLQPGRRKNDDSEWIRIKTPHLFLRIDISYEKEVKFHTAFHFDCLPRSHGNTKTDFYIKLLDEDGKVIKSSCLFTDDNCCTCGCSQPYIPVKIRQAIPYTPKARTLVLFECEKEIYRQEITDIPKVSMECNDNENREADTINLRWSSTGGAGGEVEKSALIQWMDRKGVWRGCGPRTFKNEVKIPKYLFGKQQEITLRVLVSTGIATGVSIWKGACKYPAYKGQDGDNLVIVGIPAKGNESIALPSIIRAVALQNEYSMHNLAEIRWYDEKGAELAIGKHFNLSNLPMGESILTASVLDSGQGSVSNQWLIRRTEDNQFFVLRGDIDRKKSC